MTASLAEVIAATSGYVASDGPHDLYPPGGFVPEAERRWYIDAALAGIELGAYDRRIVAWLGQWDDYTARLVVSLLVRARRAGYAEAATDAPILPSPRIDSQPWTCRACGAQMIGRRPADDRCRDCGGPDHRGRP